MATENGGKPVSLKRLICRGLGAVLILALSAGVDTFVIDEPVSFKVGSEGLSQDPLKQENDALVLVACHRGELRRGNTRASATLRPNCILVDALENDLLRGPASLNSTTMLQLKANNLPEGNTVADSKRVEPKM